MRLKLELNPDSLFLPANYNYCFSAAIYKLLKLDTPEFTSFLRKIGFTLEGRLFKFYNFALRFSYSRIDNGIIILNSRNLKLYISFPLIDDFFCECTSKNIDTQKIEVVSNNQKYSFLISDVQCLPTPSFQKTNKFTLLSPIVLSSGRKISKLKPYPYYLRFDDNMEDINRVFNQNLRDKYQQLHESEFKGKDLIFKWDNQYIESRLSSNNYIAKKITIQKENQQSFNVIANFIPFVVTGDSLLIKTGFECGFGQMNSMGFGMAGLVSPQLRGVKS